MRKLYLYIALCICLTGVPGYAASPEQSVKEGNSLYEQGKYDEAVQKFQEAKGQEPDSDIANFNLGAALFKKGDFKESIDAFTQSLKTESSVLESDAAYNIANAKYKMGNELLNSDLNSAADLYRESLDYYKRSIDLNETNSNAKHNHELVEKELKVILDQIKNQPKQDPQDEKDKDEDQKEENKENQQSQEDSEGDKEKQDQEQQPDEQQAGEEQKQEEQQGSESEAGDQGEDQEEAAGQEEDASGEMSPEEAKMLLDAFADEEAMDNLKNKRKKHNGRVLKDW